MTSPNYRTLYEDAAKLNLQLRAKIININERLEYERRINDQLIARNRKYRLALEKFVYWAHEIVDFERETNTASEAAELSKE